MENLVKVLHTFEDRILKAIGIGDEVLEDKILAEARNVKKDLKFNLTTAEGWGLYIGYNNLPFLNRQRMIAREAKWEDEILEAQRLKDSYVTSAAQIKRYIQGFSNQEDSLRVDAVLYFSQCINLCLRHKRLFK